MRINLYEEELTEEVEVVDTVAETGKVFYGVRIFLKSAPELHCTETDDDRSAVTFWIGSQSKAEDFAERVRAGLYLALLTNTRVVQES